MSISDDGQGVPAAEVERVFFAMHPQMHALGLLRRRLQALFGRSFKLEVYSDSGQGTTVTLRIPLRRRRGIAPKSSETVASGPGQLLHC
jgi:sensor histidine kinase YesM